MAYRGRDGKFRKGSKPSGGKRRRSSPRTVTIRENIVVRGSAARGLRRVGRGIRRHTASGTLARERGPISLVCGVAGWLDYKRATAAFATPALQQPGLNADVGALLAQIPSIGPVGWMGVVGAAAHIYHAKNRRSRWADRVATAFMGIETYKFGYRQSGGTIAGSGPASGSWGGTMSGH